MRDRGVLSRPGGPVPGHDLPALLRKLAAPRGVSRPDGGADGGALGEGDAALAALLDEIDETVMARRVTLANAAGEELTLEVCNRRLLRAGPPQEARAAANATLTYAGLEDLAALRASLARFCAAGGAHVRERRPGGSASLEQTGVAVATLRQAWALPSSGAPGYQVAAEPDPRAFRAAVTACAIAGAETPDGEVDAAADAPTGRGLEGAEPRVTGDAAEAARLAGCLEPAAALLSGPAPSALILGGAGAAARALVLLRDGDGIAAFVVPASALPDLVRLWGDRPA